MKKIGKLAINAEKVIKNEELVNLIGGYDGGGYAYCTCYILWEDGVETKLEGACGTSSDCDQCARDLESHYSGTSVACE